MSFSISTSTPYPLQLGGCRVWIDHTDHSIFTFNGANVQDGADKSGHKNGETQLTPANQPLYVADALNGNSALDYTADFMDITVTLSQPMTFICYHQLDTIGNGQQLFSFQDAVRDGWLQTADPGGGEIWSADISTGTPLIGSTLVDTDPHWALVEYNGASSRLFIDNNLEDSNKDVGPNGTTSIRIGSNILTGTFGIDGKIQMFGVYDRILSDPERNGFDTYFKNKMGS